MFSLVFTDLQVKSRTPKQSIPFFQFLSRLDITQQGTCLVFIFYTRTMSCRTGSKISMTTDTLLLLDTLTMASQLPSRTSSSCANFSQPLYLLVHVSTLRLIFHSWMCTASRQILPRLCASHHPQRRARSQWRTLWNALLPSIKRRSPSLQCTIWLAFIQTRCALLRTVQICS